MSSTIIQVFPLTSPIIFITCDWPAFGLLLSTIARPTLRSFPRALALSVPPTSGAIQIKFLVFIFFFTCLAKIGVANKLSTGISKKPWIWPACKSTVTTLSAPALAIKLDTNFAEIDVRGTTFLSCLAYPKYGITAVIFLAEDLFNASMHSNNSIRLSLAGDDTDWITKILFPLIFSFISI